MDACMRLQSVGPTRFQVHVTQRTLRAISTTTRKLEQQQVVVCVAASARVGIGVMLVL
jgi:hypothetical protein